MHSLSQVLLTASTTVIYEYLDLYNESEINNRHSEKRIEKEYNPDFSNLTLSTPHVD